MRTKITFLLFFSFLISSKGVAQISGYIFSVEEKLPMPYVNIAVAGKPIGFTANQYGAFEIPSSLSLDSLIFSSIGYRTLHLFGSKIGDTVWMSIEFALLNEVVVKPLSLVLYEPYSVKKGNGVVHYASNDIPWRLANYFTHQSFNDTLPLVTAINVLTDSPVKNAVFKLSIVQSDKEGKPTNQPLVESVLVTVKKGMKLTFVDLDQAFEVPKNGYFIILETLNIKENEYLMEYIDEQKQRITKSYYAPKFAGVTKTETCCVVWRFVRGIWYNDQEFPMHITNRLAISVIYSN